MPTNNPSDMSKLLTQEEAEDWSRSANNEDLIASLVGAAIMHTRNVAIYNDELLRRLRRESGGDGLEARVLMVIDEWSAQDLNLWVGSPSDVQKAITATLAAVREEGERGE